MIDKLPNNGFMTGDSDNLQNARNEFFDDYENTAIPTFTNDNLTNTNNNTPPPTLSIIAIIPITNSTTG